MDCLTEVDVRKNEKSTPERLTRIKPQSWNELVYNKILFFWKSIWRVLPQREGRNFFGEAIKRYPAGRGTDRIPENIYRTIRGASK